MTDPPAPFGTVLGYAPGGVAAYSSDYDTVDERLMADGSAYRSVLDGIPMGYKWQCVEFARRYLYLNCGWTFDDVAMAYDIFRLRTVREVLSGRLLPLHAFRNGGPRPPEPGCLVIWGAQGEFERTGHVAVVTEVLADRVRVAEQNVDHRVWPEGQDFAREIPIRVGDGGCWLSCPTGNAAILGWVIQTADERGAEPEWVLDPRLYRVCVERVADDPRAAAPWLDVANPDEAAYVAMMGGHHLATDPANRRRFVVVSETAHTELKRATEELHALFLHATEHVLRDEALLERFRLPRVVWPRIRQSWGNRRNQMISGRFDLALTEQGPRVYEYNCDSAACYMEAGLVQGLWARHHGCAVGRDPGEPLLRGLVGAWRASGVDGVLHIMIDRDLEETYHAGFMRRALAAAGIETRILEGVSGLQWVAGGGVADGDGAPIRWVWKTWAWETALDQLRAECADDEERPPSLRPDAVRDAPPRLVDVLLRPEVMVFEPLWTLIPSNKAILPVLWELFPDRRYLLPSSFELGDEIRARGYVQKPIRGRRGANISLFDANDELIEETAGDFASRHQVFQELCPLPVADGLSVQLSTFTAAGGYAGSCVRVDPSPVITAASDNVALRVVGDDQFLRECAVLAPSG